MKNARRNKSEEICEQENIIKEDLKTCLQLADEKVALALQTYELVQLLLRKILTYPRWTNTSGSWMEI
jgi:hypothetical protein